MYTAHNYKVSNVLWWANYGKYFQLIDFAFSRWRPSTILNFQIRKFLMPYLVCMAQMHYYAKFRQNWSNGWGDMAVFQFFKIAAVCRLGFWNSRNFNSQ